MIYSGSELLHWYDWAVLITIVVSRDRGEYLGVARVVKDEG